MQREQEVAMKMFFSEDMKLPSLIFSSVFRHNQMIQTTWTEDME